MAPPTITTRPPAQLCFHNNKAGYQVNLGVGATQVPHSIDGNVVSRPLTGETLSAYTSTYASERREIKYTPRPGLAVNVLLSDGYLGTTAIDTQASGNSLYQATSTYLPDENDDSLFQLNSKWTQWQEGLVRPDEQMKLTPQSNYRAYSTAIARQTMIRLVEIFCPKRDNKVLTADDLLTMFIEQGLIDLDRTIKTSLDLTVANPFVDVDQTNLNWENQSMNLERIFPGIQINEQAVGLSFGVSNGSYSINRADPTIIEAKPALVINHFYYFNQDDHEKSAVPRALVKAAAPYLLAHPELMPFIELGGHALVEN